MIIKKDENLPIVGPNSLIVPFMACGDLSGFDSDRNYELGEDYIFHNIVQSPINPPYQEAIKRKKQQKKGIITNDEKI